MGRAGAQRGRPLVGARIEFVHAFFRALAVATALCGSRWGAACVGCRPGSAGLPGQPGHPAVEALIAEVVTAARGAGKPVATVPRRGKFWQALFDEGIDIVATGSEIYYFGTAATAQMQEWRAYCGSGGDAGT